MLSACVSMWTISHKIYKVWVLINQVFPRSICSYGLWLESQAMKSADISESIDITQSMSINRFYSIETEIFHQRIFYFPIIHHNYHYLQIMWEEIAIRRSRKPDVCALKPTKNNCDLHDSPYSSFTWLTRKNSAFGHFSRNTRFFISSAVFSINLSVF